MEDSHQTTFHRVPSSSVPFPTHVKRFEVKMFTFMVNSQALQGQVYAFYQNEHGIVYSLGMGVFCTALNGHPRPGNLGPEQHFLASCCSDFLSSGVLSLQCSNL